MAFIGLGLATIDGRLIKAFHNKNENQVPSGSID
jgi:hypothetical protein